MNREEVEKILTHGEWFYFEFEGSYKGYLQFDKIDKDKTDKNKIECLYIIKAKLLNNAVEFRSGIIGAIKFLEHIRPASKQEVLRYFPDEYFPEPLPPRKRPITRNKKQYILR